MRVDEALVAVRVRVARARRDARVVVEVVPVVVAVLVDVLHRLVDVVVRVAWASPKRSPSTAKESAAPTKGAVAKIAWARVAPSCCAAAM
jgi:hypothetical protein